MQTSYSMYMPIASYPGQPADNGKKDDLSVAATTMNLPFGVLVVTDTVNSTDFNTICGRLPVSSADVTTNAIGVVVADQARTQNNEFSGLPSVAPYYPQFSCLPCRRQGRLFVLAEGPVVNGGPVFVRFATGPGGTGLGSLRGDTDTASAALLQNAIWRSTVGAGGFAVIELNLV